MNQNNAYTPNDEEMPYKQGTKRARDEDSNNPFDTPSSNELVRGIIILYNNHL